MNWKKQKDPRKTYNARSELISARRTKNGQPIPGFSEDFDYDPIGNRRSSATYNEKGEALTSTYAANNLNQYISRTTPGYAAVRGEADPNAFVTVDENPTFRFGSYFFGSDLFDNSRSGRTADLLTYAALTGNDGNDLVSSHRDQVYVSQSPETFAYDDDGNQTLITTATGLRRVTYNGENRPVRWELVSPDSNTPNSSAQTLLLMPYDHMGRRRTKNTQRFVYNGYLQIANHNSSTSYFNYYLWDPTEPVATRPLAWLVVGGNTPTSQPSTSQLLFYTHDGNKNVSEVIASDNGVAAHYEYAPFGAVILQRGESAATNPFRFSSEYAEDDTATVYYNYRHYEPVTGRWLQRDPIGERGGVNLFLFAKNSLEIDYLGRKCKVGKVRNVKFTFEYASEMDNGINLDEMIDAYDKIQIYSWLSIGAGVSSGVASGVGGGLTKACCQGVTTGVDEGAGLAASKAHDTKGAVDECKELAKIMASAYPRIRGLLTYEECVCKRIWFISYTTWEKTTIGPSAWHELVGGVNINEGWLPPDSFETEEEAKRNIKEELSMK